MKIGFVLECSLSGPDAFIYPYVAKQLCSSITVEKPVTLTSQKGVMQEGVSRAQTLLDTGCAYVFIIWDRMPKWGETGAIEDYIQQIEADIIRHKVARGRIFLCCIDEMLESWMIADARGINRFFRDMNPTRRIKDFSNCKSKSSQSKPKEKIKKYARTQRIRYDEFLNPIEIVKRMPDFNEPAQCNASFKHFKDSIEGICPE